MEGCVQTVSEAVQRAQNGTLDEAVTALDQIRDANLLLSRMLRDLQSESQGLRPDLGKRTPPTEANELAEKFKKDGKLY
jgi:hypothetical protein